MRASGLAFRPSDRHVDNDELVGRVLDRSELDDARADRVARTLRRLLEYAGAHGRYWTESPGDIPDLVVETLDAALGRAGRGRSDVDLLISTSVDRSVLEPAHAYNLAGLAGMSGCQCFDVTDGCNGWLRATQIAQGLLRSGAVGCVAVVSTEFNMMPGGSFLSDVLRLDDVRSLRSTFPPMTLGDGVAVAVLEPGGSDWEYTYLSRPDLVELCYAPLGESARYRRADARGRWRQDAAFVVDGAGLFREAETAIPKLLSDAGVDIADVDDVIVHGATSRQWATGAAELGGGDNLRNVFGRYGNVVSASIPAALATAVPWTSTPRDVLAIGASAGMSFALTRFEAEPAAVDVGDDMSVGVA